MRHHAGPQDRLPGQQPYQGVVPLHGDHNEKLERLSDVLQHYMLQSEQLDTVLVLAANSEVAAGLLIQRMPLKGEAIWPRGCRTARTKTRLVTTKTTNRIAHLASSLTRDELLTLDVDTILRRLFWEEKLLRFEPLEGERGPRFACTCSRERVANMLRGLGAEEAESILAERSERSRWVASSVASNTASMRWMRRSSSCNLLPPNRLRHRAFNKPRAACPRPMGRVWCAAPGADQSPPRG